GPLALPGLDFHPGSDRLIAVLGVDRSGQLEAEAPRLADRLEQGGNGDDARQVAAAAQLQTSQRLVGRDQAILVIAETAGQDDPAGHRPASLSITVPPRSSAARSAPMRSH